MEPIKINVRELVPHEDNPRTITSRKFETLKTSLTEFPEMLKIRPIVVDGKNRILAGNMRYRACLDLGWDEVWIKRVEISEDRARELMVKDNLAYGDWDWDAIEFNWDTDLVNKWLGKDEIDYSALDDYDDILSGVDEMYNGVKKAITLNVGDKYDEIKHLEKQCREIKLYIGGAFISRLEKLLKR